LIGSSNNGTPTNIVQHGTIYVSTARVIDTGPISQRTSVVKVVKHCKSVDPGNAKRKSKCRYIHSERTLATLKQLKTLLDRSTSAFFINEK
jgi:hypothetical protein